MVLGNGLTALAIHDPLSDVSAAALAVEVSLPQNLLVPEKMRRSTLVNRIRKMTF